MLRLMKLDGSAVLVEPRTITRVEREGTITRVSAGIGNDLLVLESPDEIQEKIRAETIGPSTATR
jgi:uncharacterized protein YlzI (FlbEa/FlbD family)